MGLGYHPPLTFSVMSSPQDSPTVNAPIMQEEEIISISSFKNNEENFGFPPGYIFSPMDEQLIYYLKTKIDGKPLPKEEIMSKKLVDVELYNHHPGEITENYKLPIGERNWYFFTPRERKYPNGDRPKRSAGSGYWKATGKDMDIKSKNGTVIGARKALVFYEGKPPGGEKTNWIMHEYRINETKEKIAARKRKRAADNNMRMRLDDCVLCKIYKKSIKEPNSRQEGYKDEGEDVEVKTSLGTAFKAAKAHDTPKHNTPLRTSENPRASLPPFHGQQYEQKGVLPVNVKSHYHSPFPPLPPFLDLPHPDSFQNEPLPPNFNTFVDNTLGQQYERVLPANAMSHYHSPLPPLPPFLDLPHPDSFQNELLPPNFNTFMDNIPDQQFKEERLLPANARSQYHSALPPPPFLDPSHPDSFQNESLPPNFNTFMDNTPGSFLWDFDNINRLHDPDNQQPSDAHAVNQDYKPPSHSPC